jgi:hypothetical protein
MDLTVIFLIIILFLFIYNCNFFTENLKNTLLFDRDANYQYIMDLEKTKENNSSVSDQIMLVANDKDKQPIFKFKDTFYKLDEDKLVSINEDEVSSVTYLPIPTKVPVNLSNMTLKIKLNYNGYKYVGLLNNSFYNQEYILYEKPYDKDNELENKLYYYILVKIIDNKYTVMYDLPPRNKITLNEYVWASQGPFQIGPLLFN